MLTSLVHTPFDFSERGLGTRLNVDMVASAQLRRRVNTASSHADMKPSISSFSCQCSKVLPAGVMTTACTLVTSIFGQLVVY